MQKNPPTNKCSATHYAQTAIPNVIAGIVLITLIASLASFLGYGKSNYVEDSLPVPKGYATVANGVISCDIIKKAAIFEQGLNNEFFVKDANRNPLFGIRSMTQYIKAQQICRTSVS